MHPVRQSLVPATTVALQDAAEHESPGELLGQLADGAPVPQSEVGVDSGDRLPDSPGGAAGHQSLPDAPPTGSGRINSMTGYRLP